MYYGGEVLASTIDDGGQRLARWLKPPVLLQDLVLLENGGRLSSSFLLFLLDLPHGGKVSLVQSPKIRDFGCSKSLPAAASEGSSTFSAIFFPLFLPLSTAESDEGKEVAVPVGLRDGILLAC
ncbi:hypothetical protein ACE6H2_001120 [Prunus campanulata]